jgi:hypothetical protein
MMSRRIFLYALEHVALIVEDADGVRYENQAGGVTCYQGEMEGVLCPLDVSDARMSRLEQFTYPGTGGITVEVVEAIDELLAADPSTSFIKVDRERMDESTEAWVYVLIDSPAENAESPRDPIASACPLKGFGPRRGVLTWSNSD